MAVLVTGATGMFGARVTEILARSGVEVLAMTRSRERAEKLTRGTVTGVVADLDDGAGRLRVVRLVVAVASIVTECSG